MAVKKKRKVAKKRKVVRKKTAKKRKVCKKCAKKCGTCGEMGMSVN